MDFARRNWPVFDPLSLYRMAAKVLRTVAYPPPLFPVKPYVIHGQAPTVSVRDGSRRLQRAGGDFQALVFGEQSTGFQGTERSQGAPAELRWQLDHPPDRK